MCGISGIYNLDGKPADEMLLKRMNRTLAHRGPDDEGYYAEGMVGLGQRRLSIIDLHTGKQPVFNEDKSIAVVFNGEIYNFQSIKDILAGKGHIFSTKTDTEVIVHAYEEWGYDCVHQFRGMFAFALWDSKTETLFMARDRLGIKPLYYYYDEDRQISFASEIKALLEDKSINREFNLKALSDYFSLGYIPSPKSIFKKIHKLSPGHYLICRNKKIEIKNYWDISFKSITHYSEKQYCEQLIDVLQESVKLRLISDVPLGAFLSGGIDSSIVVALMSGLVDDPVITNSIGFSVQQFNELEYASQTAKHFKTSHNEFTVTPDALEVINKLAWHYDEPFADSSSIPTYYVSKMTKNKVTVALSGDGGDENFAGYRRYYFDRLENNLRQYLPAGLRKSLIGSIASIYPKADSLPQMFRAKTLLTNLSREPVFGYFNSMSMFLPEMKNNLFSQDLKNKLSDYDSMSVFSKLYNKCDSDDPLTKIQYIDFKTYLPEDILTKVDRASMANSLEVRVPILDHKFVELAATIPSDLKLNGKTSKYIFKKTAEKLLTPEMINRKKMGFSIPIGQWMKQDLSEMVNDLLFSSNHNEDDFFNKSYVKTLWDDHSSGRRDYTQPLWTLLSFKLWARNYMQ